MPPSRTEHLALSFLALGSPALLAASLLPGRVAAWVFALLAGAFPVALMALGAGRRRSPPSRPSRSGKGAGGSGWALLALLIVLVGTAAGVLLLAGTPAGSVRVGGLPLATVVLVAGLWLLPLPLAALGYALSFDRTGLTEEDLARLRGPTAGG